MNVKRTEKLPLAAAVVIGGLTLIPALALAQPEDRPGHMMHEKHMGAATKPDECDMCKAMRRQAKRMTRIKELLNQAKDAARDEGAQEAVEKIDEALEALEMQHEGMHRMMKQHMQDMHKGMMGEDKMGEGMKCPMCGKMMDEVDEDRVVNARCPIQGTKLDRDNVPESLTREWKGMKIGFCCPGCPEAWDELSDDEKQAKLDAAMGMSEQERMSGHEAHHSG